MGDLQTVSEKELWEHFIAFFLTAESSMTA